MPNFAESSRRLRETIDTVLPVLRAIDDHAASAPRSPGKWSRKQILGHLIDSASNNHQRFVRAQEGGELLSPGYHQDHWVNVQGYHAAHWTDLITLWSAYNGHLVRVIAGISEQAAEVRCSIGTDAPVTLAFLVGDYVDHLWHHLAQIGGNSGGF